MGAVPVQEAKWLLLGKRAMAPTSTSRRAAPEGPMPCRSVRLVPVAVSSSASSLSAAFLRAYIRSRSLISSAATRRRALPATSRGRMVASSFLAWAADRSLLAPPGNQLQQQLVQLGNHPRVVLAQRPAPVDQHAQHGQLFIIDHRSQPAQPGADQCDRVRVGGVGLTALAGGGGAHPGGQLRRDVDDLLAVGQEPQRDVPADAVAALDGPHPLRPLSRHREHVAVPLTVGAEPT